MSFTTNSLTVGLGRWGLRYSYPDSSSSVAYNPSSAGPNVPGDRKHAWEVRAFRESDAPDLLSLYSEVFGRPRSEAEFRWKLFKPDSPVDTVWVAARADRVVGQHAGIPTWLKLGVTQVLAMHAVEAMTHQDHRREGMLTELGGGLYGHWRDSGVPLVMGLPHAGWGSRAAALGYREVLTLQWLSRPLRPLAMLEARLLRQAGKGQRA